MPGELLKRFADRRICQQPDFFDEQVIGKILEHPGLWEVKKRPPPRADAPSPNIAMLSLYHLSCCDQCAS